MKNVLKFAVASAAIILIGQGCVQTAPVDLPTQPPSDAMMKKDEGAVAPKEDEATMRKEEGAAVKADLKPYYIAYSTGAAAQALKDGRGVVYYFYASWCPICRADEPIVKARVENSGLPVAGFRVNYDEETALKAKYKIPYQHTTVFLNAKGEEVERLNGPVDDATFQAALKKASS